MRFLVDAQLPKALVTYLKGKGHNAIHVNEMLRGGDTTDTEIAQFADAHNYYIVISKDSDFRDLHIQGSWPKRLLWVTTPNLNNSQLIAIFDSHAVQLVAALTDTSLVELREDRIVIHRSAEPDEQT